MLDALESCNGVHGSQDGLGTAKYINLIGQSHTSL